MWVGLNTVILESCIYLFMGIVVRLNFVVGMYVL